MKKIINEHQKINFFLLSWLFLQLKWLIAIPKVQEDLQIDCHADKNTNNAASYHLNRYDVKYFNDHFTRQVQLNIVMTIPINLVRNSNLLLLNCHLYFFMISFNSTTWALTDLSPSQYTFSHWAIEHSSTIFSHPSLNFEC